MQGCNASLRHLVADKFRFPLRGKTEGDGGHRNVPKPIHLHAFREESEQCCSPGPQTAENCENGSLNPFLGSRKGKYQSILFRLARLESSHLQAVMSYSKCLHDVRGRQMASCSESPFSLFDLYFIPWVNPNEVRRQRTFLCCWQSSLRYNLSALKCLKTLSCYKICNRTLF